MAEINASKLMETMQSLVKAARQDVTNTPNKEGFQNVLQNAIGKTNELMKASGALAEKYEKGDPSVELVDVMIASQKSSVSFQALTQVRNRLVNAYQDIMNMQI